MKLNKLFPKIVAEFDDVCVDNIPSMISEVEELSSYGTVRNSTLNVESSHRSIQTIHRLPSFKPLAKQVLSNATKFLYEYGYDEFLTDNLYITNMWFNVSGKGDYLFPHTHPGSLISGAYYLDSDESHNIYFYDMHRNLCEQPSVPTELNTDTYPMPCTPGTMYLFHSDFVHSVPKQEVDARKIVISFNLSFENLKSLR
jgi:uncharacterized protein (TIGR02466 family)